MNLKEYCLEKITGGGTWKVWLLTELSELKCVALFAKNSDAHDYKAGLQENGNEAIVTRSSTIMIETVDETE